MLEQLINRFSTQLKAYLHRSFGGRWRFMPHALIFWPYLFTAGVVLASNTNAESSDAFTYIATALAGSKGTMPACTPLSLIVKRKKVTLMDVNKSWGKVKLTQEQFESLSRYDGFDECVSEVPQYSGRYNADHLVALAEGEFAVTMPLEFALMILGPPTQPPMTLSMLNPVTGKPDTFKTYMWMRLYRSRGVLSTAINLVGGAALGVAGVTSNLDTAINALRVANAASSIKLVTRQVSDLSQAKIVTIQVNSENQISLLMAQ